LSADLFEFCHHERALQAAEKLDVEGF
jgi:hypothetical protein